MTNPFSTPTAQNFGLLMARATLGIYFTAVGYKHIMAGVSNFAKSNLHFLPTWITPQYGEVFLALYPVIQFTAGIMLALGFLPRISAFLLTVTILFFVSCITGLNAPAGMPFDHNLILLAVAIALLTNGGGTMTLPAILGKKGAAGPKAGPTPAAAK